MEAIRLVVLVLKLSHTLPKLLDLRRRVAAVLSSPSRLMQRSGVYRPRRLELTLEPLDSLLQPTPLFRAVGSKRLQTGSLGPQMVQKLINPGLGLLCPCLKTADALLGLR